MNLKAKIYEVLKNADLRITPQRVAVLEAFYTLKNHPTADKIIQFVQKKNPNIAVGTIYKVIDILIQKEIVRLVKTDKGVMRYDEIHDHHHHLVSENSDMIEDYYDEELDELLKKYFEKKRIENFTIEDIKVEITGNFDK
ncbi:putative Peroxide operon regulator [uncultured Paludibacter sp.]|nr:putative Peroxide operon regulator [uncultured Paludibacter sp.]